MNSFCSLNSMNLLLPLLFILLLQTFHLMVDATPKSSANDLLKMELTKLADDIHQRGKHDLLGNWRKNEDQKVSGSSSEHIKKDVQKVLDICKNAEKAMACHEWWQVDYRQKVKSGEKGGILMPNYAQYFRLLRELMNLSGDKEGDEDFRRRFLEKYFAEESKPATAGTIVDKLKVTLYMEELPGPLGAIKYHVYVKVHNTVIHVIGQPGIYVHTMDEIPHEPIYGGPNKAAIKKVLFSSKLPLGQLQVFLDEMARGQFAAGKYDTLVNNCVDFAHVLLKKLDIGEYKKLDLEQIGPSEERVKFVLAELWKEQQKQQPEEQQMVDEMGAANLDGKGAKLIGSALADGEMLKVILDSIRVQLALLGVNLADKNREKQQREEANNSLIKLMLKMANEFGKAKPDMKELQQIMDQGKELANQSLDINGLLKILSKLMPKVERSLL